MSTKRPQWCKNESAVAKAFGMILYDQRPKLHLQLAAVREATQLPGFPRRIKRLWPLDAVVHWGIANLKLDPKRRTFTVLDRKEAATGYDRRLEGLYEKWLHPEKFTLKESELKELVAAGKVKGKNDGATAPPVPIPDYCSQNEFAELVSRLYNVPVYPMRVSRAVNDEGMPGRMTNGSLKTSLALPWWEANIVSREMNGQGSLFHDAQKAKLQREIDEGARIKLELDEAERSLSDKWILKQTHEFTLTTAGVQARNSARDMMEKQLPAIFGESLTELVPDDALRERLRERVLATGRKLFDQFQGTLKNRLDELLKPIVEEKV